MKLRVQDTAEKQRARSVDWQAYLRSSVTFTMLFALVGCVGVAGPAQLGIGAGGEEVQPVLANLGTQDETAGYAAEGLPGAPPPVPSKPIENSGSGVEIASVAPASQKPSGEIETALAVAETSPKEPAQNVIEAAIQKPAATQPEENSDGRGRQESNDAAGNGSQAPEPSARPKITDTAKSEGSGQTVEVASANVEAQKEPSRPPSLFSGFLPPNNSAQKVKRTKSRISAAHRGRDEGGTVPRPAKKVKRAKASRIASAHDSAQSTENKSRKRPKEVVLAARARSGSSNALPGVRSSSSLFGIRRTERATNRDSNDNGAKTQLAALAGAGRLSPNGVRVQHSKVQVHCLKPAVLAILKIVERKYGRKPIVTSGYRSPQRNRRAGGARNSQHIYCKAVDIQVEGVSKWELAKYLRSIPGRGGVGTYCRTKSVHVDIGKKRDWHHPCRRSSVKKRKKRRT